MSWWQKWLVPALLAAIFGLLLVISGSPDSDTPKQAPIASAANDQRTAVPVTPEQSAHALGEMRGFVAILSDIYAARTANDTHAMAAAAIKGAPQKPTPVGQSLQSVLPPEFKAMSKAMRADFKAAADAARMDDIKDFDEAIGRATNQCVACHESYRFTAQ